MQGRLLLYIPLPNIRLSVLRSTVSAIDYSRVLQTESIEQSRATAHPRFPSLSLFYYFLFCLVQIYTRRGIKSLNSDNIFVCL